MASCVASCVALDPVGTQTLTLALHLASLDELGGPSVVAERLPKALIRRNVPGEPVHALLRDLDAHWARQAPHSTFSPRQRFIAAVAGLRNAGWPVHGGPTPRVRHKSRNFGASTASRAREEAVTWPKFRDLLHNDQRAAGRSAGSR